MSNYTNRNIKDAKDEQTEMGLSNGLIGFSIGLDADIERAYRMMKTCIEELGVL